MTTILLAAAMGAGTLLCVSSWCWPETRADDKQTIQTGPLVALEQQLRFAGLGRVTPAGFIALSLLFGVMLGALLLAFTGIVPLAVSACVVGMSIPWLLLRGRARQRRKSTAAMWPDIVDHLVAAVRSGSGLADAVVQLGQAAPASLRPAFESFTLRYRATGSFTAASVEAKAQLADPVADRLFATLQMAHEVGGTQLVRVLRELATHLREAQAIRHEVEARQSWVVNAARLGVVAPWAVLRLLASRPEAAAAYNSPGGAFVILTGALISVVAYRLMLQLGRIPEEGRWFA